MEKVDLASYKELRAYKLGRLVETVGDYIRAKKESLKLQEQSVK